VTQPLDRSAKLPELGEVDREGGEVWVENPFLMPSNGLNLSAYERNRLFLNLQGRGFLDASFASGADIDSDSRAAIAADFDRDGHPDLLIGSVGGGPLRLFLNRAASGNRRLRLELVGVASNRPAIGARVVARIGERSVVRDVFARNGSVGQGPAELDIGSGTAGRIDRLTVRWPSGRIQRLVDVPSGGTIRIVEGQPGYQPVPVAPASR